MTPALRQLLTETRDVLRALLDAPAEHDDVRLGYVTVQIDRPLIADGDVVLARIDAALTAEQANAEDAAALQGALVIATRREARLRKALLIYGNHADNCAVFCGPPCDCGLAAAAAYDGKEPHR